MKLKKSMIGCLFVILLLSVSGIYDAGAQVKGLYKCIATNPSSNKIECTFNIANQSPDRISLAYLALRYYYTKEGTSAENAVIDYPAMGSSTISVSFAGDYFELRFVNTLNILYPGTETGEIHVTITKADSSAYNQSDDYSFGPSMTVLTEDQAITLYDRNTHLWGTAPLGTATPTPPPTPVDPPDGTCVPCNPSISISNITIDDTYSIGTDRDWLPDPGEIIALNVESSSRTDCCSSAGSSGRITITTNYPKCTYIGRLNPSPVSPCLFYIDPTAVCDDAITFYINAYIGDTTIYAQDHQTLTLRIGSKPAADGGYTCDPAIANPELSPKRIEAETFAQSGGIVVSGSIIDSCDNGDWIKCGTIDFGPGSYYKRFAVNLSATGTMIYGEIELHIDRVDSTPYCTMLVRGTSGVMTENELLYNAISGKHDVYLVFRGGSSICTIDWISFGPEKSIPLDTGIGGSTPLPTVSPYPNTYTPAPQTIDLNQTGFLFGVGQSWAVAVSGNYAYVGNAYYYKDNTWGLTIYDITDRSNPVPIGFLQTAAWVYNIVVAEDYAYVSPAGNSSILIVDVTDKKNPKVTGKIPSSRSIAVSGNIIYQASGNDGMIIRDISVPSTPTWLGTFASSASIEGIKVRGNYVYVTCMFGDATVQGLCIIDATSKTAPVQAGFIAIPYACGLDISGNYAFVGSWQSDAGFTIVDITNPTRPVITGSVPYYGEFWQIKVSGNHAYCVQREQGITVIDIRSKTAPFFAGGLDRNIYGIDIDSTGTLFAAESRILRSFVASQATPTPVGLTPDPTPVSTPSSLRGDVNGSGAVDIVDALLIAQYYVGLSPANFNPANADLNCSATIDIVDALLIAQYYVGLIMAWPCQGGL